MKNATKLYKQALARLEAGAKPDDLNDDEYRVFMFTTAVNSVIDLAKRFKARPLGIVDGLEDTIVDLQKAGQVKVSYGEHTDDDDEPWF